ncbi:MAG: HigA family addiction module antitoxin [Thermoguttaceae bacterium]
MPNHDTISPIHPGEVLLEEFLLPLEMSVSQLATALHVSGAMLSNVVEHQEPLTAELALRLARLFGNSPQFWLGIQFDYDLDVARSRTNQRILQEVQPVAQRRGRGDRKVAPATSHHIETP